MKTKERLMDWARETALEEANARDVAGNFHDTTFREKELLAHRCVILTRMFEHERNTLRHFRKLTRDFARKITQEDWYGIGEPATCPECDCITCICEEDWCDVCNDMECSGECQENWD